MSSDQLITLTKVYLKLTYIFNTHACILSLNCSVQSCQLPSVGYVQRKQKGPDFMSITNLR